MIVMQSIPVPSTWIPLTGDWNGAAGLEGSPVGIMENRSADPLVNPTVNGANPLDTSGDGSVTALDALLVINSLNRRPLSGNVDPSLDVTGDGYVTPIDALSVINHLNQGHPEGEQTGQQAVPQWVTAADIRALEDVYASFLDDDDEYFGRRHFR
jgi:hypothetical protein